MKISYINQVRDTKEEESVIPVKQLKYSMLMAITHENIDLIEPLLSKGTPLIEPLSNGKSALMNACDVGNELIIEKFLIRSMRSFSLFPSQEILHILEWLFANRLYRIVDLTFFSIKQSQESMSKYGRFIEAVEALEKLGDPSENKNHDKLLATYKEVITSIGFRKDFYYYLFYVWKKIDHKVVPDAINLYQLLSEAFEKEQKRVQNNDLLVKRAKLTWNIGAMLFIATLLMIQILTLTPWTAIRIPLLSIIAIGALYLSSSLIAEYRAWIKQIQVIARTHDLVKNAREGRYSEVSAYLESDGFVNVMEGVAESTPLREAERMGHKDIKILLRKFGAFSAEGAQTFSFPQ